MAATGASTVRLLLDAGKVTGNRSEEAVVLIDSSVHRSSQAPHLKDR